MLDAAHTKNIFGIGVDADQGYLGPWVMTSAQKKVDVAVHTTIMGRKGREAEGRHQFDLRREGRRCRLRQAESKGPASIRNAVAAQYKLLKAGKIKGIPATVK